ncbi:hypothetical protein CPC16_009795 [Podila verticillata]|nr:hypothetical protein CPC16_009795 [Podila verticillata]
MEVDDQADMVADDRTVVEMDSSEKVEDEEKVSVRKTNINRDNREGHLAYLIYYHNSYQMRRIMMKSEDGDEDDHAEPQHVFDDDNQEMKIKVAESWSSSITVLPVEMNRGACLTLAFLNFLVNSSGLDADRGLYKARTLTRGVSLFALTWKGEGIFKD